MNKISDNLKKEIHNYEFKGQKSYAFLIREKLSNGNMVNVYVPDCDPDLWNRNSIFLTAYKYNK